MNNYNSQEEMNSEVVIRNGDFSAIEFQMQAKNQSNLNFEKVEQGKDQS